MASEGFFTTRDNDHIWYHHDPRGEGPPLVLCDGLGCDGFIWSYITDRFRGQHPIIHHHYRGHGRSPRPRSLAALSLQQLVHDLRALLDHLDVPCAVLLGHSLGVQVILEFYRHAPERVLGLVPVCGSYGRPVDSFYGTDRLRPLIKTAIHLALTLPGPSRTFWNRFVPRRIGLALARVLEVNSDRIRDEDFWPYFEGLGRVDADVFFKLLDFAIDHTTLDLLPLISAPVQIIAGGRDGFTPLSCSEHMHRLLPNSHMLVLHNGTHTAPLEFPLEVEAALETFLARVGERRVCGAGARRTSA